MKSNGRKTLMRNCISLTRTRSKTHTELSLYTIAERYNIFHLVYHSCQILEIFLCLQSLPQQIQEQIDLMKNSIAAGTTSHAVSVERVVTQYDNITAKPAEESVFYMPIKPNF